jgi:preprotein translocase subunit SecY
MFKAFANIFRIPELRNRVLFTLGVLAIYRIGFWIPVVGVDQSALVEAAKTAASNSTGFGRLLQFASIFSGGSLGQSTVWASCRTSRHPSSSSSRRRSTRRSQRSRRKGCRGSRR